MMQSEANHADLATKKLTTNLKASVPVSIATSAYKYAQPALTSAKDFNMNESVAHCVLTPATR